MVSGFFGDGAPGPLILTALFDPGTAARLEALRRAHYPADLNRVPAHLTLFHVLPPEWLEDIIHHLEDLCWQRDPMEARGADLRLTGHGVALDVTCPALLALRAELAAAWRDGLTPQDRQRFVPHVTIQNKVAPKRALRTYDALRPLLQPFACMIEGLALWRYQGGPWDLLATFPFGAGPG